MLFSFLPALLLVLSAQAHVVDRSRRQTCECTPGEAPKCGCQMMPSTGANANRPYQMVCTCSPPTPPKCVCKDTKNPILPTPTQMAAVTKPPSSSCSDVCKKSCLDPCMRLPSNRACEFSCSKQQSTNNAATRQSTVSEYKFILPAEQRLANPTATPAVVQVPAPALVISQQAPSTSPPTAYSAKVCEASCMPDCSFACTTFKPALRLVSQVLEGGVGNAQDCRTRCGESCMTVCSQSGISLLDCANNCGTACDDTCGLVVKTTTTTTSPTPQCAASCMPSCSQRCMDMHLQIMMSLPNQVPATPPPEPPTPAAIVVQSVPDNASPLLQALCQNECSVQCEHQCGVNSLAGPQCLAACQTTCYPVCQAKLRRKHLRATRTD